MYCGLLLGILSRQFHPEYMSDFNWHTCRYVYMYIYACMQIYCNCNCKQRICNSLCNTCNMHELHERYERHTLCGTGRSQTAVPLTHLQALYRERTFHGTER